MERPFISGGRKPLRDALYMPALVAMRFNPDLKKKYQTLRDAGKPAKVAIVAIIPRFWIRIFLRGVGEASSP